MILSGLSQPNVAFSIVASAPRQGMAVAKHAIFRSAPMGVSRIVGDIDVLHESMLVYPSSTIASVDQELNKAAPKSRLTTAPPTVTPALSMSSRLENMARSASLNPQRIFHASLGMVSLIGGLYFSLSLCMKGFDLPHSSTFLALSGITHTATALVGCTRLDFGNQREACRTAQYWPVCFSNAWMTWASLTEWAQGPEAPLSMQSHCFCAFTAWNIWLVLYQLVELWKAGSDEKQLITGLWLRGSAQNMMANFFANQIVLLGILIAQAATYAGAGGDLQIWNSFLSKYPEFGRLIANVQIDIAFATNFGLFLTTTVKYKAIPPMLAFGFFYLLNVAVTFGLIVPVLHGIGGGAALNEWWAIATSLVSQPMIVA